MNIESGERGRNVEEAIEDPALEQAFERHRRELQLHCYRMTGSVLEAEDLVQETLLRAWMGRATYAGRASVRAWLYRIATNVCLDAVARRKRRLRPADYGPPEDPDQAARPPVTETLWLEPYPDALLEGLVDLAGPEAQIESREAVELAFIAAVQHLPARQRAALLLHDVLGWTAAETAGLFETSVASVNSALQRARATLRHRIPAGQDGWRVKATSDRAEREIVARYVRAWEAQDVAGLVALLKQDAELSMPPQPSWYCGRDAVGAFLSSNPLSPEWQGRLRLRPTRANGQPAFAVYHREYAAGEFAAFGIMVLRLDGDSIREIAGFIDPRLFPPFGLPAKLAASDSLS